MAQLLFLARLKEQFVPTAVPPPPFRERGAGQRDICGFCPGHCPGWDIGNSGVCGVFVSDVVPRDKRDKTGSSVAGGTPAPCC